MGGIARVDFDNPAELARWQDYVTARGDTHATDHGQWRRLYRDLYGIPNYSYIARRGGGAGGEAAGVVSLYHFRSPFMGSMLVSSPFFGYGGLYADDDEVRDRLLARVRQTAVELGVDFVELRLSQALPPPFAAADNFLESHLDLRPTAERVWTEQLSSNARQNVRRARRSELEFGLSSDPRPCHDLLRRALRALGTPFHGRRMFRLLRRHFADETRFSEVRHRGRLIAAGVVMRFGDTVLTPFIGSLRRYGHLRANYLQYWGIIEHCLEHGARRFELGRSPRESTHIRFKRKWGARDVAVRYNHLVVDPRRVYRNVATLPPAYRLATGVWKRLPLALTTLLGPRLARYVP